MTKLNVNELFDKNEKQDGRKLYRIHCYKDDEILYDLNLKIKDFSNVILKDFDYAVLK
jgi:hypothetical protein